MEYNYFNANPDNRVTNDCVIRAIAMLEATIRQKYYNQIHCIIIKESYRDIYMELAKVGVLNSLMINDERNYIPYVMEKYQMIEMHGNGKRVCDIDCSKPTLLNLNGHLTFAKDNIVYDTFDCRKEEVQTYYVYK